MQIFPINSNVRKTIFQGYVIKNAQLNYFTAGHVG